MTDHGSAPSRPRLAAIDVARGLAIVAMVAYHLSWDLSYLGLWPLDISVEPGWIAFQRTILSSFLLLVGVGLVLGHGAGVRWRPLWRRFAIVGGAALLMSAGTYYLFGEAFAFFGILHAIAVFSVLGALFARLPPTLVILCAAGFILPALFVHADMFNTRWLAWIGFWTEPPRTADLVAFFPWFGVTLLGIAAAQLAGRSGLTARLARWRGRDPVSRGLAFAGRWSLLLYLLHQPLLLGVLNPLADWMQPPPLPPAQAFVQQCEPNCLATGGVPGYCTAYCSCALDAIESGDLWAAVNAEAPTPQQSHAIDGVITLCRAMAE